MKPQLSSVISYRLRSALCTQNVASHLLGFFRALITAFLIGLPLLVFAAPANGAATYIVATTGNDANPGTTSQPFATLQKAHDVAIPGDTIYVRGGIHILSAPISIVRNGSSGNLINVFNYPGEVPILDGSNLRTSYYPAIQMNSASWWHFLGLEIRNAPAHGLYLSGTSSNNIVEQCNVHNNVRIQLSGAGIAVENGSNNLILNNDSHHNGVPGTTGGDGIGVNYSQQSGNVVRGNRVWRNNDDGIDLWGSANVLIENNWSWENGYSDALIPSGGDGNGFKLGGGGAGVGSHTVQNNVAWGNLANGFDDNSASLPMNIFNNTAWNNAHVTSSSNYAFYTAAAHVLRNNLAYSPNTVIFNGAVVHDHNSWNMGITVNSAQFASLDFSAAAGPRNADGSLPDISFLKLTSGSGLIDKGMDVGLPYTGNAPDLGAYEFTGTSTSAIVPVTTGNIIQPSCSTITLNVSTAATNTGFAFNLAKTFGIAPDSGATPTASVLRLFENGLELTPPHAAHADIRNLGAGRFSHWTDGTTESLYFSASDNSDPRSNGKSYSYCIDAALADATVPTAPAGLSAVAISSSQINLSWPASTDNIGVTGYNVYRNGAKIATVTGTAYYDMALTPSTRYSYSVSASDAAGNSSDQSGAVSVRTPRR